MKENKADNYEEKIATCLNCDSPNIVLHEIVKTVEGEIGIEAILRFKMVKVIINGIYQCETCKRLSAYPVLHKKLTTRKQQPEITPLESTEPTK